MNQTPSKSLMRRWNEVLSTELSWIVIPMFTRMLVSGDMSRSSRILLVLGFFLSSVLCWSWVDCNELSASLKKKIRSVLAIILVFMTPIISTHVKIVSLKLNLNSFRNFKRFKILTLNCIGGVLKARKALRALRGLVKLQALVRGHIVRKQIAGRLLQMQAALRARTRARALRAQIYEAPQSTIKPSHIHHLVRRFHFPAKILNLNYLWKYIFENRISSHGLTFVVLSNYYHVIQ